MKYYKKLILFFIFFIFHISSASLANDKIVFIDINKVIISSNAGSLLIKDIKKLEEINSQNFKKIEDQLKEKEQKILSEKNIISTEQFDIKVKDFKSDVDDYNKTRRIAIDDVRKKNIDNTNDFLKLINELIGKYSDENLISLVFPKTNILIGKNELDITDDIIVIVNENIKKIKVK